jgi:hypothetical protein
MSLVHLGMQVFVVVSQTAFMPQSASAAHSTQTPALVHALSGVMQFVALRHSTQRPVEDEQYGVRPPQSVSVVHCVPTMHLCVLVSQVSPIAQFVFPRHSTQVPPVVSQYRVGGAHIVSVVHGVGGAASGVVLAPLEPPPEEEEDDVDEPGGVVPDEVPDDVPGALPSSPAPEDPLVVDVPPLDDVPVDDRPELVPELAPELLAPPPPSEPAFPDEELPPQANATAAAAIVTDTART